jgi:alpha-D-ribose 1-methylphosphonate 5-triphosphate synthase subunit PhnI
MSADNQIVILRYSKDIPQGMSMDAGLDYSYRVSDFVGKFQEEVDYIIQHNPEYLDKFMQVIFGKLPDLDRQNAWDYAEDLYEESQLVENGMVEFRYNGTFPD